MSLYYETAPFLSSDTSAGSLKSRVFNPRQSAKSQPKQIFALASEAAKWSPVLAEVIESSQLLQSEHKLTPELALLLVHDLLLAKRGIQAPAAHALRNAVEKHKARLTAELVKARLRKGCSSLEQLRASLEKSKVPQLLTNGDATQNGTNEVAIVHPRWVRVNSLKATLQGQLDTTFAGYSTVKELGDLVKSSIPKVLHIDKHIPDLVALPASADLTKSVGYLNGLIILQDKASCFPAYLLDPKAQSEGHILDACAAPGNKTSHLAALLATQKVGSLTRKILACERDKSRAQACVQMIKTAGASKIVDVHGGQDFLKTSPQKLPWSKVSVILLDPSCSGSGMVGRDEELQVTLPQRKKHDEPGATKKRKRTASTREQEQVQETMKENAQPDLSAEKLAARLERLSTFQLKLLLHAFTFPKAIRMTYSTCSIYAEENEYIVVKALTSREATEHGWRILRRDEQIVGLQKWHLRGSYDACKEADLKQELDCTDIAESCIRCSKSTEDGTQGFFVAGFVKQDREGEESEQDEWEGFDDEND
ncbi:uncharacterized protein KY384_006675 [Bacidia gigantensis]|uniref:uncharacterized protein n=1 Tax=Bacidia gigantensis TaxID=2732470 RepID=UPI001D042C24|nr:uncharacterized protein KY384_006675 [Bacidia gigantensis]KAG8528986.1 hypothetical protein KY384_006675 [Bacidia gigantensis]